MNDAAPPTACAACGTHLAASLLSCPACGRLVHAAELGRLVAEADAAERRGACSDALALLRHALELLPDATRQHDAIQARVLQLSQRVDSPAPSAPVAAPPRPAHGHRGVWATALSVAALLLFKFKWLLVFLLTKGKLLLAGLSKGSTLFSMFLSMGAYWTMWGWKFALGAVLSIYVHEMGHVAALRHYGIRASAPMFIPGLGAFIRVKQYPASPRENAVVGLAGPIWGTTAALALLGAYYYGGWELAAALAHWGAFINLFNLIPLFGLDGDHGFSAMSRGQRGAAAAALWVAWALSQEGLLLLLALVAVARLFGAARPAGADRGAVVRYVALVAVLSWINAQATEVRLR